MTLSAIPKPKWLPDGWRCWGQHGSASLTCWCGQARSSWLRRAAAHCDGRHGRPQVDCWVCWELGRFPDTADAPRHEHGPAELCAEDCNRWWWEARKEERSATETA